jgi:hypothetical protein
VWDVKTVLYKNRCDWRYVVCCACLLIQHKEMFLLKGTNYEALHYAVSKKEQFKVWQQRDIQKTLNTNECTKSFFVYYNTLLHVSTLLGHLQGETFCCRYTRLHYTVERECAVDCALRRFWRCQLFVVSACTSVTTAESLSLKMTQDGRNMQECITFDEKTLCAFVGD